MTNQFLLQPLRFGAQKAAAADSMFNSLALTDDAALHLRDTILAILFTAPGERVNNPRFGVGLDRTVFEGMNEITIAAVEFRVTEGLRRDLGAEALISGVDIETRPEDGQLILSIDYALRSDRVPRNLEIEL